MRRIEASLSTYNDAQSDQVKFAILKQNRLNAATLESVAGQGVDIELMLHQWGRVADPYEAYYGLLDVSDVQANWGQYGQRLTAKNLRHFRGKTDVNDGIAATLTLHAEHLFYLNNGLTILCDDVNKKMVGVASRESGVFVCSGASIVNGAQTVGTILQAGTPNVAGQVLVRIISLQHCPPDFGQQVTRATNTQNRIERKDFAALDPLQQRLAADVLLEAGKRYAYKTGDSIPAQVDGCTIDDAAVALACASDDVDLTVRAKREIGALYDNTGSNTYSSIFTKDLTGRKLWRAVQVLQVVEAELRKIRKKLSSWHDLVAVHGNRLLLHVVFKRLVEWEVTGDDAFTRTLGECTKIVPSALKALDDVVNRHYAGAYPASLFKNALRCTEMERYVLDSSVAYQSTRARKKTTNKTPKVMAKTKQAR